MLVFVTGRERIFLQVHDVDVTVFDCCAVVRLGPDHYEIRVHDFGTITLVPPAMAETLYRDDGLGQGVSSMDAAVCEIEGVLAEV
jgi:hypothetical protein